MPFVKGHKRVGGRVKGGNKATRDVISLLHTMGHNPVEALIMIAQDKDQKIDIRARANMFLVDKYIPSLKAIELSGPGGGPVEMSDVSPRQRLEDRIARIAERRRAS